MTIESQGKPARGMLLIEDDPCVRTALAASFQREGWTVEVAVDCESARKKFAKCGAEVVISDVHLPDGDGVELMRELRRTWPGCPFLLLTAFGNVPQAVEAVRGGACDYLQKPVPFVQLKSAVERVLRREVKRGPGSDRVAMVGESAAMRDALRRAEQAARSDADVLIEAESGTGKELLARFIHENSSRQARPFVPINCAAVPEALLEAELFGHARGAFTGATGARTGKVEAANGGTLLLDEIGEMPVALQPKLLRVLQEREFTRLGELRSIRVDVRVIATTNRRLQDLVEQGRFRLDLYYRLNVIPLSLPPLRERSGDVQLLAEYFLAVFKKSPEQRLSEEFLAALRKHDWPGNVRELANLMRRVTALCSDDLVPAGFFDLPMRRAQRLPKIAPGTSLRHAERSLLEATLVATGGNRTRAAEMLGVSLRTVRNKIRDYGLPPRRYA